MRVCRIALDPNHETTDLAVSALAQLYGKRRNLKKLGSVLVEACQITSMRHGPNSGDTAGANQAAGMCFLVERDYPKAEPYFAECVTYWAKNQSASGDRFFNELQYGVSLLAQRKYPEAKQHFLIGYNGMWPARERNQSPEDIDLSRLIELISQLRDDKGNTFENSTLALLHNDPAIRAIVLDLGFPADPFAP